MRFSVVSRSRSTSESDFDTDFGGMRAIFATMEKTQHPNVYLDLSHLPESLVKERFPGIAAVCQSFGLNVAKDRIPVRPGAHYMVGGVTTDAMGRTTVPNLSGGYATIMPNHHITKPVLIGEIQDNGQFDIVSQTAPVVGDEWSDYLEGSKDLISDWRKPLACGNFNVKTGKCGG